MTIQIHKLTPPQITALRQALPACVEAGVLTTSRSIATFTRPEDYRGPVLFEPEQVAAALLVRTLRGQAKGQPLEKVLAKLLDPTRSHIKVLD